MERQLESPPRKMVNTGYCYCSHCEQRVSNRTFRKHSAILAAAAVEEQFKPEDQGETLVPDQPSFAQDADIELDGDMDFVGSDNGHNSNDTFVSDTENPPDSSDSEDLEYSSSEYEEEEGDSSIHIINIPKAKEPIVHWFVVFVRLWQTMFSISDIAIGFLLKFMAVFFKLLATLTSSGTLGTLAAHFPGTSHLLKKYLGSENQSFIRYTICPACFSLYNYEDCFTENEIGDRIPKRCTFVPFPNHPQLNRRLPCNAPLMTKINTSGGHVKYIPRYTYAYQPIKLSLQKLLNRPGLAEQLEHWRKRKSTEGYLSDIYDGKIWEEFSSSDHLNFLQNKRCYGLMLNFDFFQPYKHTTDSYGVFYITLMNLPREIRFKQENILLVGIIPSFEHEPTSLNSFMEPLVKELKEFWNPGVRLFTAESPKFKLLFRLALLCVACDIPAARKVCGFMGHSANYGCSRCLKFFPGGCDFSGFDRKNWPLRVLSDHLKVCKKLKSCRSKNQKLSMESETGIKYSILTELPYFNPIRFTIIDPMHNLFLGTAKHILKIWIERDLITKEHLKVLQTRVDSMGVPSAVGRIPRKIASTFGGFTAEQWKNWVTIYSMFALRGILPEQHYNCWQAFVLSCFFLCRRELSHAELIKADLLLLKFCKTVQDLYGPSAITPNIHLHCHLVECVKDYGSVYNFWLFSYERYNGILGNYPTNKRNSSIQLMERFIYDSESFQLSLPDSYSEIFKDALPLCKLTSEVHCHQLEERCSSSFQHATLSSISKFAAMNPSDCDKIKDVYTHLYKEYIAIENIVQTIKVYKTITLFKQHLGSLKSPSTVYSSYIMASWAESDGSIATLPTAAWPGKVLYYFTHQYRVCGNYKSHLFAAVYWYKDHHCHLLYGKPLEIWSEDYIEEGPAMFLPIDRLLCRCATAFASIPIPGGSERVLFVSPLPGLRFS